MSGTKIKICGLFRSCDAGSVNAAMPDYAGFVFYEKSPRNVTPDKARSLRGEIDGRITTVGVFVDAPIELIVSQFRENIIDIIQLHGGEDKAFIARLRDILPEAEIWKAYKVRTPVDIEAAEASTADLVLLDNGYGTGQCFDWTLIQNFSRPFILAGGLTPENIPDAIERFRPCALDLSTGVETDGAKDGQKIIAAVNATRRS